MRYFIAALLSVSLLQLMPGAQICAYAQQASVNDEFASGGTGQQGFGRSNGNSPNTWTNMQIYYISRKAPPKAQAIVKPDKFLTLGEALKQKQIVVDETGDVNVLTVQNLASVPIFIQGGEILKGGRQDRALQSDMILPAKSQVTQANVVCVESGRWHQRGAESDKQFSASEAALPNKELRLAATAKKDQDAVWSSVAQLQGQAGKGLKRSVASPISPTSLQLTLENKDLHNGIKQYLDQVKGSNGPREDVVGCAVVINGKVVSSDIYGSPALFKKEWPKLLQAASTEALLRREKGKTYASVPYSQVKATLRQAELAAVAQKEKSGLTNLQMHEDNKSVLLRTTDADGNQYHRSYLIK